MKTILSASKIKPHTKRVAVIGSNSREKFLI